MAIASIIVQPLTGNTEKVKMQLSQYKEVDIHSISPKGEIIIVMEAGSIDELNAACTKIGQIEGVAGVFPSYVTTADEEN